MVNQLMKNLKRIIRIFPRRTKATPDDDMVRVGIGPGLFDEADEVHVSVTFTWDLPLAEQLAKEWEQVAPVKIGGPATGMRGEDFIPGMYLKHGYTITSRGCPNRCWFCSVWKRDGEIRELPIREGWNVLDDNLLACSDDHIANVFSMLSRQKAYPQFTGGFEAKRLKGWQAKALRRLKTKQIFFAYDEPGDILALRKAAKIMLDAGFTKASHALRCFVLCGYNGDTKYKAESRMREILEIGFTPMAMLWRDDNGKRKEDWIGKGFQKYWARPAYIHHK